MHTYMHVSVFICIYICKYICTYIGIPPYTRACNVHGNLLKAAFAQPLIFPSTALDQTRVLITPNPAYAQLHMLQ